MQQFNMGVSSGSNSSSSGYGCFGFLFDIIMTVLTCGFWLIWVFCREMRKR